MQVCSSCGSALISSAGSFLVFCEQAGQRAGSADDLVSVPGKTSNSKPKSLTDVRIENDVQCGCTQKC